MLIRVRDNVLVITGKKIFVCVALFVFRSLNIVAFPINISQFFEKKQEKKLSIGYSNVNNFGTENTYLVVRNSNIRDEEGF